MGRLWKRLHSAVDYAFFVYGLEFTLAWAVITFLIAEQLLDLDPAVLWTIGVVTAVAAIVARIITLSRIVRKWSSTEFTRRPIEGLLEMGRTTEWQTSRAAAFPSSGQFPDHRTVFWTDFAVNELLWGANTLPASPDNRATVIRGRWERQPYELPTVLRELAPRLLHKTNEKFDRRQRPIRFNGKLLRLASEPTVEELRHYSLSVQPVSYFDGECSNETLGFFASSNGEGNELVAPYAFDRLGRIKTLEHARAANIVGISVFAITSDGRVVMVRQTHGNSVAPDSYASSGSGSLGKTDRKRFLGTNEGLGQGEFDFGQLIMGGMLRELREETGVYANQIVADSTRLTGYFRWISRAAKPEFTGIARLSCDFATLRAQSLSGTERAFTQSFTSVPAQLLIDAAHEWSVLTRSALATNLDLRTVERWSKATTARLQDSISKSVRVASTPVGAMPTPTISPSCEFAWLAAAQFVARNPRYFDGIDL